MPSPRLRRTLLADKDVSRRLALGTGSPPRFVGMGPPTAEVETAPAHVLAARGDLADAARDVVSRYFDIDGDPSRSRTRSPPGSVALPKSAAPERPAAPAGAAEGPSILGAARAGLIDGPWLNWTMPAARAALELG